MKRSGPQRPRPGRAQRWGTVVASLLAAAGTSACGAPAAQPVQAPPQAARGVDTPLGVSTESAPALGAERAAEPSPAPRSSQAGASDTSVAADPCSGQGVRARQRCAAQREGNSASAATREGASFANDGMARPVKGNPAAASPQELELQRAMARGQAALMREDYDAAVKIFRQARKSAPRGAAPLVGLVQARVGQLGLPSEYAGAAFDPKSKELLALLDEALRLEPEFGQAHLERGRLLLVAGESEEARQSLVRAVALLPADAEAHSALAVAYLAQGNVDEALAGFKRASDLEPQSAERLTNLGTAFMMQGDVEQAISAYRRAVGLAPNDARSRGDLGTALLAINDPRSALPHLRRAQELAPSRATFMSNLGYAYQRLADEPAAEQWYRRAVQADPKLASAWINLGTLQAAQKKFDAAEQSFQQALAIDPEDPRAIANLAELRELR